MGGGIDHRGAELSQLPLIFRLLVHLPFTFHACGLLASNLLSRGKTPLCVTTMLVRVVTLFTLCSKVPCQCVRMIATFSPRFSCTCWQRL